MITKHFSVFDATAKFYSTTFPFKTIGEALRSFSTTAQDPKSQIGQYPKDFSLYHVGEYDDQTGKYTNLNQPVHLGTAQETIPTEPQL